MSGLVVMPGGSVLNLGSIVMIVAAIREGQTKEASDGRVA